jgi:hypothetical protein
MSTTFKRTKDGGYVFNDDSSSMKRPNAGIKQTKENVYDFIERTTGKRQVDRPLTRTHMGIKHPGESTDDFFKRNARESKELNAKILLDKHKQSLSPIIIKFERDL